MIYIFCQPVKSVANKRVVFPQSVIYYQMKETYLVMKTIQDVLVFLHTNNYMYKNNLKLLYLTSYSILQYYTLFYIRLNIFYK